MRYLNDLPTACRLLEDDILERHTAIGVNFTDRICGHRGALFVAGSMRKLNIPRARGFVPELSVYSFFTAGFHFASLAANSLVNVAASTPSSDWTVSPSSPDAPRRSTRSVCPDGWHRRPAPQCVTDDHAMEARQRQYASSRLLTLDPPYSHKRTYRASCT